MDRLLFGREMESGLRLQEFSEGRGIDVAVEGGLEADRFEPGMEEPPGAPLGARALLAPGLLQRGPVELQVKAQVVGDGERGPLIEQGDEVRRDGASRASAPMASSVAW